jgi:hypothetical protein
LGILVKWKKREEEEKKKRRENDVCEKNLVKIGCKWYMIDKNIYIYFLFIFIKNFAVIKAIKNCLNWWRLNAECVWS